MTMDFFLVDGVDDGAATLVIVALLSMLFQHPYAGENDQSFVRSETLLRSTTSWDGERHKSYPTGQPELSILKITVPPHIHNFVVGAGLVRHLCPRLENCEMGRAQQTG